LHTDIALLKKNMEQAGYALLEQGAKSRPCTGKDKELTYTALLEEEYLYVAGGSNERV
jgi:hypothetical protein